MLEDDQHAIGLALSVRLEEGGEFGLGLDWLVLLVQFDCQALAGASQQGAILLLALVEVVGGAGPAQPIGAWLLQNDRIQADLGTGTKPRGVNKVRVRFAGLGQGRKEFAAEGQSGRGGRDDLKAMPPGETAATLMGSLHWD